MRIALVTIHYPPLRSSCAVQMRDLANELVRQGHEPVIITPSERIRQACEIEFQNGVEIVRVLSSPILDESYFRRAINEVLLPVFMWFRLRKYGFLFDRFDGVVWYSPSICFGLLIWILKRASKCKSYLILRDIFPEWAVDLGLMKKGPVYYFFKLIAKFQYFVADIIGVQTPSNLEYLGVWAKQTNKKLEVLQNWLSYPSLKSSSIIVNSTCLASRKIFVYIGNMGVAQGMDILIDLAHSLKHRNDIGFLFVGRGSEVQRLRSNATAQKLDNVLFYDEINSEEIPALLDMCDVGLIALDPRHKSHNIPGKFLTYIQSGLPVLARVNKDTDLQNLINNENVGRAYVGDGLSDFKKIAEQLIDDRDQLTLMSNNGRRLSEKMFSSSSAVKQIINAVSN